MRSATSRVGSPCNMPELHFAGLAFALETVLAGRGGLESAACVVVKVVRGLPARLIGQYYNIVVLVAPFPTCWMPS